VVADAVATPYHVARDRLKITAGDRVAVLGAGGGMGVHMLQVVRAFGGVPIGIERDPKKLAALEAGGYADLLVDSGRPAWAADLAERAGGDIAGFVDTVGTRETLSAGAEALGPRGGLVVLGYVAGADLTLSPADLLFKEAAVMGTRYCNRAEIGASLELVRQGRVRAVIGARYPLARLNEAFAAIRANAVFGRIVIDIAAA
jgi:D-arabinose 1-dehydrogenase-like Zn-dependent alcohol dehydrogenase